MTFEYIDVYDELVNIMIHDIRNYLMQEFVTFFPYIRNVRKENEIIIFKFNWGLVSTEKVCSIIFESYDEGDEYFIDTHFSYYTIESDKFKIKQPEQKRIQISLESMQIALNQFNYDRIANIMNEIKNQLYSEISNIIKKIIRIDNFNIYNALKTEEIMNRLKLIYGTTRDENKAGYLLPDGSLLDMSLGKKIRKIQHKEIIGLSDVDVRYPLDIGMIRIIFYPDENWSIIHIRKKPTNAQIKKIADLLKKKLITEIIIGKYETIRETFTEYDRPYKVIGFINNYFYQFENEKHIPKKLNLKYVR